MSCQGNSLPSSCAGCWAFCATRAFTFADRGSTSALGIYVGWTAIDNAGGDMPFRNEQGDRILVFSGEEFPEPGTSQALPSRGHEFDQSGFSYLVHAAEEDPSFPASLDGRFHGLLANRESGEALLFNDRYGMNRVYYHESAEAFYFAAEAKAILAAVPNLSTLWTRTAWESSSPAAQCSRIGQCSRTFSSYPQPRPGFFKMAR